MKNFRFNILPTLLPALLFLLNGSFVCADGIVLDYNFSEPQIIDGEDFCNVYIPECRSKTEAGKPVLPFFTARILLPQGARLNFVSSSSKKHELIINLKQPVQFGRSPISDGISANPGADSPDPTVYSGKDSYPSENARLISVQRLHGRDIALIAVYPVLYEPANSRLRFNTQITVNLSLENPPYKTASLPEVTNYDRFQEVMEFVDNPETHEPHFNIAAMFPSEDPASPVYDYLIITTEALSDAFTPLAQHKENAGLSVKISTVEEILSTWQGTDSATSLRQHIAHAYTNWNTKYVLLGGGVGTVPHRTAYGNVNVTTKNIPCDVYFACLDGSWNSNGNDIWGEPDDGENGGDVDLLAEVIVGRALVNTPAEASAFVEKTIRYELDEHTNAEHALLAGEDLGNGIHGGAALDKLLPSLENYAVNRLDDRYAPSGSWTGAEALQLLNASPHIVAHTGHANVQHALRLNNSSLSNLSNTSPFIVAGTGCHSGNFTHTGKCFAQAITTGSPHGAALAIMNTDLGWYGNNPGTEWMFSGEFMMRFFSRLLTKNEQGIATAFIKSREEMLGMIETGGNMPYRWCFFTFTFFGDPHTALKYDSLSVSSNTPLSVSGYAGGPLSSSSLIYTITNSGTGTLSWAASSSADWLEVSPSDGTITSGVTTNISVTLTSLAETLPPGKYTAAVCISNTLTGFTTVTPAFLNLSGNISFLTETSEVLEDADAIVTLEVIRHWHTNLLASVDYSTMDISATAGEDYTASSGTLHFQPGETSAQITIPILDDDISELTETFAVILSNATGTHAYLEAPATNIVTILDNDWHTHFSVNVAENKQRVGEPFNISATARTATGNTYTLFEEECVLYGLINEPVIHDTPFATNTWDYPLSAYKADGRTQSIYSPDDVGGPGLITALSIRLRQVYKHPLSNWTIRLKHTPHAEYGPYTGWETNDWTVALQTNITFQGAGWQSLDLATPFLYNGKDHLMVDFSFNNEKGTSSGNCYAAITETYQTLFYSSDNVYGDPLLWNETMTKGYIATVLPGVRFTRYKELPSEPPVIGTFADGEWTGLATVLSPSTNAVLYINDLNGHGGFSEPIEVSWRSFAEYLEFYGLPTDGSADNIDSDGDSFTNFEEWLAGTDPTDATSFLSIEEFKIQSDGSTQIKWKSIPGKVYDIESASSIEQGGTFSTTVSNILSRGYSTVETVETNSPANSQFYRIRLRTENSDL
ncbi:MAG: hypothetical protein GX804_05415 [Lentisphaerae bacterium]|nr:hypothetical protein [Lentisphaerota bacterium]